MTFIVAVFLVMGVSERVYGQGQGYRTSVGVGLGPDMSVNFKHFLSDKSALELQGAYNIPRDGVMFSLVYQYHVPIGHGFSFYGGGGINIGGLYLNHKETAEFAIGIAPTVGFEYAFAGAPIALAIDYKPNINFTTSSQWNLAALKLRFTW